MGYHNNHDIRYMYIVPSLWVLTKNLWAAEIGCVHLLCQTTYGELSMHGLLMSYSMENVKLKYPVHIHSYICNIIYLLQIWIHSFSSCTWYCNPESGIFLSGCCVPVLAMVFKTQFPMSQCSTNDTMPSSNACKGSYLALQCMLVLNVLPLYSVYCLFTKHVTSQTMVLFSRCRNLCTYSCNTAQVANIEMCCITCRFKSTISYGVVKPSNIILYIY